MKSVIYSENQKWATLCLYPISFCYQTTNAGKIAHFHSVFGLNLSGVNTRPVMVWPSQNKWTFPFCILWQWLGWKKQVNLSRINIKASLFLTVVNCWWWVCSDHRSWLLQKSWSNQLWQLPVSQAPSWLTRTQYITLPQLATLSSA